MGSFYARICAQMVGVEVVALCDVSRETVESLANELGVAAYPAADYRQMLKEHHEIDAVLVCTREDSHRDPSLAALEANKHLMVEKPLATNVDDAKAIFEAAQSRPGLVTMMAHTLRFDPRYSKMKDAVARKEIGELICLYGRRTPPYAALERIHGRVALPFWVGIHDVDMMRWVACSEVARVFAVSSQGNFENRSIKSVIISLLTFENGVVAALENAWGPACNTESQQSTAFFRAQGTRGVIEVKNFDQGIAIHRDRGVIFPDTVYMPNSYGRIAGVYTDQIAYFINCIRLGTASEIQLEDGVRSVIVAEAIIRSADSGKEVILSA